MQVPRLWGWEWPWEHARLIGPLLGAASLALVRPLARHWPAAPRDEEDLRSDAVRDGFRFLHRALRAARWQAVRWLAVVAVLVLLPVVVVAGHAAAGDDQQLIDTQPPELVPVVSVSRSSPLAPAEGPGVTVRIHGLDVRLATSFDGDDDVHVGDRIPVVQSPGDHTYVISVHSHDGWEYSPLGEIALSAGIAGLSLFVTLRGIAPWRAVRAVRSSRQTRQVTVDHVDGQQVVLTADNGARLRTRVGRGDTPAPGAVLLALGIVGLGGWAVLGTSSGRLWWPRRPFEAHRSRS